jgi:uncharacterized protein YerC
MKKTISLATKRTIFKMLDAGGMFDTDIARATGVSPGTVGRLRQSDARPAPSTKRIEDDVRAKVKRMYDAGYEYSSITKHTGVSKSSIYRIGNERAAA